LAAALGAIVVAIGRVMVSLLWIATVVLILCAILVRAAVHVAMPPVVWPALTGAWLAAGALRLVGGFLRYAAGPRPRRAHVPTGAGIQSVGAQRIAEWESAWWRALLYQQSGRERAGWGRPRASESRGSEPGCETAASPYEVLGVPVDVAGEELSAAYRELAMLMHPDRNPGFVAEATERFAVINSAYELLSDAVRRADFDRRSGGH
jgi:hypothetical protein